MLKLTQLESSSRQALDRAYTSSMSSASNR